MGYVGYGWLLNTTFNNILAIYMHYTALVSQEWKAIAFFSDLLYHKTRKGNFNKYIPPLS